MERPTAADLLPAIGTAFEGGYFAGRIRIDGTLYAIILPPKADSEHEATPWAAHTKRVAGAASFFDGMANTKAMAESGSAVATWALEKGFYIPSRDELELLYRAFKPGKYANFCASGDNPSSEPSGYAYEPKAPGQTENKAHRAGGKEAFDEDWYWSSTQSAGDDEYAWCQNFSNGFQYYDHKSSELRVRAVRRLKL